MSILSDREIKELCEIRTFSISSELGVTYFNEDNYKEKLANFYDKNIIDGFVTDCVKTLSPDGGFNITNGPVLGSISVKRLEEPTRPMISPFVDRQVRTADDKKILSYGLSSAGYDVRLSDEFAIFNNIRNIIIDPLDFDKECLHNHKGPDCVLAPNSYILGVTVEHFDIPDDIMVVCVGKCLSGNTLITDTNTGEILCMDDTEKISSIHSLDLNTNRIVEAKTNGLINNGVLQTIKVSTRLGHAISGTSTHPIKTWNGYTKIADLRIGDRIAVSRYEPFTGKNSIPLEEARLLGYMIADGGCTPSAGSPSFTKNDIIVMNNFISDAEKMGFIVSRRDDTSVILVSKTGNPGGPREKGVHVNKAINWLERHGINKLSKDKTLPVAIQTGNIEVVTNCLQAMFTCDGSFYGSNRVCFLEYYTTSKLLAEQLRIMLKRIGLFFILKETTKCLNKKLYKLYILQTTTVSTVIKFVEKIGFITGSAKDNRIKDWVHNWSNRGYKTIRNNFDTLPPEAWYDIEKILLANRISFRSLGIHPNKLQSVPLNIVDKIAKLTNSKYLADLVDSDVIWDTVRYIEKDKDQIVYDYTVPEYSNFIANGIVVHNSSYARAGAIVNVTPIEPGFKGNIVIEISNSTPLPLKIHSHMGISQFLFFRMKNPCETPYSFGNRKYQNQKGITLAKV